MRRKITEIISTVTTDSQGYKLKPKRTTTLKLNSPKDIASINIGYRYESGDKEVEAWRIWAYALIVGDTNPHMNPFMSMLRKSKLDRPDKSKDYFPTIFPIKTFACTHLILGRVIAGARKIFRFKTRTEIITHGDANDHDRPMPSGMIFYYTFTLKKLEVLPKATTCLWDIEVIESETNTVLWNGTWENQFALASITPFGKLIYSITDYIKNAIKRSTNHS